MVSGSAPGERRGGRKKGTPNKATVARRQAMEVAGIEPIDFLLSGLAFFNGRIQQEMRRGEAADPDIIEAAFSAGKEFAKDAAPYCHSRKPVAPGIAPPHPIPASELALLSDKELDVLEEAESILQRFQDGKLVIEGENST